MAARTYTHPRLAAADLGQRHGLHVEHLGELARLARLPLDAPTDVPDRIDKRAAAFVEAASAFAPGCAVGSLGDTVEDFVADLGTARATLAARIDAVDPDALPSADDRRSWERDGRDRAELLDLTTAAHDLIDAMRTHREGTSR